MNQQLLLACVALSLMGCPNPDYQRDDLFVPPSIPRQQALCAADETDALNVIARVRLTGATQVCAPTGDCPKDGQGERLGYELVQTYVGSMPQSGNIYVSGNKFYGAALQKAFGGAAVEAYVGVRVEAPGGVSVCGIGPSEPLVTGNGCGYIMPDGTQPPPPPNGVIMVLDPAHGRVFDPGYLAESIGNILETGDTTHDPTLLERFYPSRHGIEGSAPLSWAEQEALASATRQPTRAQYGPPSPDPIVYPGFGRGWVYCGRPSGPQTNDGGP